MGRSEKVLNIRELRERLGMTQIEFAKAVSVSQGAVSQWELGLTHPGFRAVMAIAKLTGLTVEELAGEGRSA